MSDLSNLLGSVYGDRDPDAAPVRHEPAADDRGPAWDDDARLDEAFQDWTPGPGPEAPSHEREMLEDRPAPAYDISSPDPDQDLAAALSAALAAETRSEPQAPAAPTPPPVQPVQAPVAQAPAPPVAPVTPAAPSPEMAPAMPAMPKEQAYAAPVVAPTMAPAGAPSSLTWQMGDDDIFPMGRKGGKKRSR